MERLLLPDNAPSGVTFSRLTSLISEDQNKNAEAERRLKKAKKRRADVGNPTPRVAEESAALDSERATSEPAAAEPSAFPTMESAPDNNVQINPIPPGIAYDASGQEGEQDNGASKAGVASTASRIRVSFRPKEPKPGWDSRKVKHVSDKLDSGAKGNYESPPKIRVPEEMKVSKSKQDLTQSKALTTQGTGNKGQGGPSETGGVPTSKPRKASLQCPGPFGLLTAGVARLDSVRRVVKQTDAAEMRRLEDMLAKVREAVELERQTMVAERARSEASCAGVLERAAHSWLRIWQVQRVYAGSKEAALLALPWRGHLSFPFLHWKKSTQDKVAHRRTRRKADLLRKRKLFTSWRQAGLLSAGLAASLSAFERRRGRQQQRGAFAAWKASIANRKTAQFKLRHCIQTWQANRMLQAWQRWRAGVEVQHSKKALLARARRHLQTLRVRAVFCEWLRLVFSSVHAREVMRSSSQRLQQRALLRAFQGWREAVTEVQRQRAIMHRAAAHIMHSALAQAFSAWVTKTDVQRSVRHFAALLRNRAQLSAFNTWRAAVQESRQMEQDLHQVFVHRREEFAGAMLSRWRAWRSGGAAGEEGGGGGALRRCFKRWRGRLHDKGQLRQHAARLARQRVFRQWKNHTRWAKNLQSTTLKTRAFERWSAWTSVRVRGKSLATLEAALADSEERCQELRSQLKQMQDEKDAANQRAADLVAAVKSLDWKLRTAAGGGSASPPRSPRLHSLGQSSPKKGDGHGIVSRPHESLLHF